MPAKLDLGALDVCDVPPGKSAAQVVQETVELGAAVEKLGYARMWVAEHHGLGSAQASPEILVGAIAARTKKILVGSGGVLLPYYSPLKVAENFRLLCALHPGRIELGVGRGGSDEKTEAALRSKESREAYDAQVQTLVGFARDDLPPGHPHAGVVAVPRGVAPPPTWVLGAGWGSVDVAARTSSRFAFALFLAGALPDGAPPVQAYRERFVPSKHQPEPRVAIAVGAVCADDDETARRVAATATNPFVRHAIVGSPQTCRERLDALADAYGTREVLVATTLPDFAARRRSYELLAKVS